MFIRPRMKLLGSGLDRGRGAGGEPLFAESTTFSGPFGGSNNANFRMVYAAADLDDVTITPTQARLLCLPRYNVTSRLDSLYGGFPGTYPNYSAAPTQFLFDGGSSWTFTNGAKRWTDWTNIVFDGTVDIMFSTHTNVSYTASLWTDYTNTVNVLQSKVGADESNLQNVTGYAAYSPNGHIAVVQVEVRE